MTVTHSRLLELMMYDPVTGIFRWRVKRKRVNVGDEAGNDVGRGRLQIQIDNKRYVATHLAIFYVTGKWPTSEVVDHKDGDPSNNAFSNLRPATQMQNTHNRRDVKGWQLTPDGTYRVRIMVAGKRHTLGIYKTQAMAEAVYKRAAKEYYGEFAA